MVDRVDYTLDGLIFVKKEFKRELQNRQVKEKTVDELKIKVVDEEAVGEPWNEDLETRDNKTVRHYLLIPNNE